MMTASIVTFKTNRKELATVLRCLENSPVERIYIVDNSPDDGLRDFGGFDSKVKYIWGHGNIGYGAAHNIAIRKSLETGAKYHIVLNSDIHFEPGTIEALREYMEANPDVGQVMPRVVYPEGDIQYLCKLLPTPMDLICRRFIPIRGFVERSNRHFEMRACGYDKEIEVPYLSGCFMFFRSSVLNETQGFDDKFFMYCEDIDLCRRIGMNGHKTMYYPNVTVIHAHKKESFKNMTMLKAHIRSAIRYFNKWGWVYDKYRKKRNADIVRQYPKNESCKL